MTGSGCVSVLRTHSQAEGRPRLDQAYHQVSLLDRMLDDRLVSSRDCFSEQS